MDVHDSASPNVEATTVIMDQIQLVVLIAAKEREWAALPSAARCVLNCGWVCTTRQVNTEYKEHVDV